MASIPRDRGPDSTLDFLRDGYRFISDRCERHRSDIFQTRLLLERTICLRGRAGALLFYDTERFQRAGAMPGRARRTLIGHGGVQGMDGPAHRHHKAMLMSLMDPTGVRHLTRLFDDDWQARIPAWERAGQVVLYQEVGQLLTRAVCAWTGVPLAEAEIRRRTDDLRAMVAAPAALGLRHWRGRLARIRAERWISQLIERVRTGTLPAPTGSALQVCAGHRGLDGRLLTPRVAAVALLNILRPTVAVDRFITFAALALHDQPQWREQMQAGTLPIRHFVHEVRRYYPLFPAAAARVRQTFEWQGYHFPRGRLVLLDLYGTNHHPELWPEPDRFRPDRFADWHGDPYSLVPQGGGDHHAGHRCAGEWITIELLTTAVARLTSTMRYDVPPQDLTVSLRRMPTLPADGFVVDNVRRTD